MAAEERERYFAKKNAAVQYLQEHEVPKCLQKLLNDVVVERPSDIFGYMAEYFSGMAKPPTIANMLSTCDAPVDDKPLIETKPFFKSKSPDSKLSVEDRQISPENEEDQIQIMIKNINASVGPALVGTWLYDQHEIDRILENLVSEQSPTACGKKDTSLETEKATKEDETLPNEETKDEEEQSVEVHLDALTVSMAVAKSASYLKKSQLYSYLYKIASNQEPSSLNLPTPVMTVLRSDKKTPGKLYMFREVMIFMKKNIPSMQAFRQMTDIYQKLELSVQQKPTANMTADNGALTPVIDKPEQALDLLRDAISCAGYNFEDDVAVAIKLATKDIYDQDKQKYEICMNMFKNSDELVNIYVDLCARYPEVKVLVDPFLSHDRDVFLKLDEKIDGSCFLINQDSFLNHPKVVRKLLNEGFVSGHIVKMENASTVTQFLHQAKANEDDPRILFISQNDVESQEDFLVDMAVAVEADFLVVGGPGRSENIAKYNRLQAIEQDLVKQNIFVQKDIAMPKRKDAALAELEADESTT